MQLRQLEIFYAVMTTGSVSSAARLLNITQPGVSKIIRQLERNLDFDLFTRIGGRLRPSPEAQTLFTEVQSLYSQMEHIRELAQNLSRGRGQQTIKVSCTTGMAHDLLPLAIQEFRTTYPDCMVELHAANTKGIVDALMLREIDVGFAPVPPDHPAIETKILAMAQLLCIAPPGFEHDADEFLLQDFERHDLIAMHRNDPLAVLFHGACNAAGVKISSKISVRTYLMARALVERGEGLAVIDQYTALHRGEEVQIFHLQPPLEFPVTAMWLKESEPSVLVKALVTCFLNAEQRVSKSMPQRARQDTSVP